MFRRSREGREPCMRQCLLGGEATSGVGTVGLEKGTDEVLGCDVGRESQITSPQAAIDPRRTFVCRITSFMLSSLNGMSP